MTATDSDTLNRWADDLRGPVALHRREKLIPVEGEDAVFFPPTYAHDENGPPYSIDKLADGSRVVQVDSVGSQANRMEPLFRRSPSGRPANPLANLVPQLEIDIGNEKTVNVLDAEHRLGDAIVRSSELNPIAKEAFLAFQQRGDAAAIAKLAPTTLVFGAWDSRDTQAKLPRIAQAVIRAWDVDTLTRSAQYFAATDNSKLDIFSVEEGKKAEKNTKSDEAQRGFVHVPATGAHGGVVSRGGIFRDVTINLVALRHLSGEEGEKLRRYVLGLALVAACEPQDGFLRQGCMLTLDPNLPAHWEAVERSGARRSVELDPDALVEYARAAAAAFGVGQDRRVRFLKDLAKFDLKEAKPKKDKAA